jgi:opacity protein-like surface antigen
MISPSFALVILLGLMSCTVFAQQGRNGEVGFLQAGFKAGANAVKINGEGFDESFRLSFHAGGFVRLNLTQFLGIQPELIFSQSSSRTITRFNQIYQGSKTGVQDVRLNYLSIPALASLGTDKFAIQAGPQYSILLNQNQNLFQNGRNAFKNGDFSLVGGLWVQFGHFNLSGRYIIGLTDMNDVGSQNRWRSQAIQVGIGYTF